MNPDIREAHMLKGWFENGGNTADTINLSGQKGGMGGGGKCYFPWSSLSVSDLMEIHPEIDYIFIMPMSSNIPES